MLVEVEVEVEFAFPDEITKSVLSKSAATNSRHNL